MTEYNKLLRRQIRKYLGPDLVVSDEMKLFLNAVDTSYRQYDDDRVLLERAMDISSEELYETNQKIRKEIEQQQQVLKALKGSLSTLKEGLSDSMQESLRNNDLLELAHWLEVEVSKRKRIEKQLVQSESNLFAIIETSSDAIFSLDKNLVVLACNSVVQKWFSWVYGVVPQPGDPIVEILPEKAYKMWYDIYQPVLAGNPVSFEQEFTRGGNTSYFTISLNPIYSEEEVIGISAFASDITQRKEVEIRRKKLLRDLEAANKELRDFAYITSHDLKSPLRAIGSLISWLDEDYRNKFDDEGRERLNLLQLRVKRMYSFIDGMLEFTKISQEKDEYIPVDLNELVRNIIELELPPKGKIEILVLNELPVIRCEKIKVDRVFQNLLSNAIKYMGREHGTITISSEELKEHWQFAVSDNGIGIDERHFDRIFKIFQTLENRDIEESTGIGLSIVKKVVEIHGGNIWLESVPGEGSTFYFTLAKSPTNQIQNSSPEMLNSAESK